jgi:hypothetical protein
MDLLTIRTIIITSIASDERLMDLLVFKGGNALEIVHKIGQRSSLDLDYSMATDVEDASEISGRLFKVLKARFNSEGLILFDEVFVPRPSNRKPGSFWGGYTATFKLIENHLYESLDGNLEDIRRQSMVIGFNNRRTFKIEISAFEYCEGKIEVDIDGYKAFVYSIDMIAVEKLRAICQQSPNYPLRVHPTPRARDFYDIYAAITEGGVDFTSPKIHKLVVDIFNAKSVDLALIGEIHEHREFHRADWPSVENAVRVRLRQFDYYFEFVLAEIEKLQSLWIK